MVTAQTQISVDVVYELVKSEFGTLSDWDLMSKVGQPTARRFLYDQLHSYFVVNHRVNLTLTELVAVFHQTADVSAAWYNQ